MNGFLKIRIQGEIKLSHPPKGSLRGHQMSPWCQKRDDVTFVSHVGKIPEISF